MRRSRRERNTAPTLINTATIGDHSSGGDDSDEPAANPFRANDPMWTALSAAGVATVITDSDLTILWANPAFADYLGIEAAQLAGSPLMRALGGKGQGHLVRSMRAAVENPAMVVPRLSVSATDASGTERELALSASASALVPGGLVMFAEDLTANRRATDQPTAIDAAVAATQDPLTKVPNRLGFEGQLHAALRRAAGAGTQFAVALCDIDGFTELNDRYNDSVSDQLVNWVAGRLTHTLRHHDTLARIGTSQFVVIAEKVEDDEVATLVARRLVTAVSDPITIDGHELRMTMSVGTTLARGLERPSDLLVEADRALQAAKAFGPGSTRTLTDARAEQALTADMLLDDFDAPPPPPRGVDTSVAEENAAAAAGAEPGSNTGGEARSES